MGESFGVKERPFIGEFGESVLRMLVGVAREVRQSFDFAQRSKTGGDCAAKLLAPGFDGERPLQTPKYEWVKDFHSQVPARHQEINQPIQASNGL